MADEEGLFNKAVSALVDHCTDLLGGFVSERLKSHAEKLTDRLTAWHSAPPEFFDLTIELRRTQLEALHYVRDRHLEVLRATGLGAPDGKAADDHSFNETLSAFLDKRWQWFGDRAIDASALTDSDRADLLRWSVNLVGACADAGTAGRRAASEALMLRTLAAEFGQPIPVRFEQLFRGNANPNSGWHGKWMANLQDRIRKNPELSTQLLLAQGAAALGQIDHLTSLANEILARLPSTETTDLFALPAPDVFGSVIEEKTKDFYGRERLIAEIEAWMRDPRPAEQVMLIHAQLGVGKSALMAELCRRRTAQYPRATVVHFCRWDQEDSLEPAHIVRNIAAQFARNIAAYGAELGRNQALKAVLDEKSALEDPVSAWQRGVVAPLRELRAGDAPGAHETHVVLVDGLDESAERSRTRGGEPLLSLIAKAARGQLPTWLRVVLASRPDQQLFARRSDFRFVDLQDGPASDNHQDLRGYVAQRRDALFERLGAASTRALMDQLQRTPEGLVDEVTAMSDPLFLVAEQVFRFIDSADFTPKALGELLNRARVVPGIDSFLEWSFNERVRRQGYSASDVRDVLGVIAAAHDPLPPEAIAAVLAAGGAAQSVEHVSAILRALSGLVVERHNADDDRPEGCTFAHKYIEEWLDPQSKQSRGEGRPLAGDYAVRRVTSRQRIEAHCLALSQRRSPGKEAGSFAHYFERWGIEHLLDADHVAAAVRLLAELLSQLPQHPPRDGYEDACRTKEARVLERLDQLFRDADAGDGGGAELRSLESRALRQVLQEREYETGKYESVIRALVQFHPLHWPDMRSQLLRKDEDLVFRSDIGVAMAKAWHAARRDSAEQGRLFDDIGTLADAPEGSAQREIAGYAIKHICQRIEPEPWWKAVAPALKPMIERSARSPSPTDRMVAGEALLALAVQGVAVFEWVPADVAGFWQPYWPNLCGDIDAIRVLLSQRAGTAPGSAPALATVLQQHRLADQLAKRLQSDPLLDIGGALCTVKDLSDAIWPQAHQQCGKSVFDAALDPLAGIADEPNGFAFDLVRVLMLHPLWDVTECGANLLADLIKHCRDKPLMSWIDALLDSDVAHWRLRYGAVDAAYTAGRVDGHAKFIQAVLKAGYSDSQSDPYGRVRGICCDDLNAYMKDLDGEQRRALLAPDRPLGALVRHWLETADDVWLLEYLHALMHMLALQRPALPEVANALMPATLAEALRVDAMCPFYELSGDQFLERVEARRRESAEQRSLSSGA